MVWWTRALVGLGAGVVLVVMKLIGASFFTGVPEAVRSTIWLSALAAIVVTTILALIDLFPSEPKGRLFWDALTLPSLLFAMFAQGGFISPAAPSGPIQKISFPPANVLVADRAFAPVDYAQVAQASPSGFADVMAIAPDKVKSSPVDGILMFLGRPSRSETFLYVVGSTSNLKRASEVVASIRPIQTIIGDKAQIVRLEGSSVFFVTLGSLRTAQDALNVKARVQAKVLEFLPDISDKVGAEIAALLLKGTVVDVRSLLSAFEASSRR